MSDLTIGVFALQGDVREHLAALAACDVIARPVRRPAELDDVDALVIPGGESTTMSKLAIEFELFDPIAMRLADGMPAYGSCAGMIMLARDVLDGRPDQRSFGGIAMTVRRNAFGRQVDSFESSVVLDGLGDEPFHAVFIRAPWVEQVDEGVTILGRVGGGGGLTGDVPPAAAGRIVAVRQGNLLATSFHPEITGDLRVHRYFVELVRAAVEDRA
ncbi:MAG TPA: pyridoxal 5'-phosphate synthase glutaminase subunit PdxT [Micromonosporaceae bacterium]|nr:pyridoxal 5'-phosphate synthase glutaminase subunit PdxT [Micromonosporaceae bacterium]